MTLEVREALRELTVAGEVLRALSGTVTQSERLLAMAEGGFDPGVQTRPGVEDAGLSLMQAKKGLAPARRDCLLAGTSYRYVIGTLE